MYFLLLLLQINRARQLGQELDVANTALAKSNLLCLMMKLDLDTQPQWSELTEYFKFVKAVFCILVSTCIVESCFSLFTALKGKYRSMLRDGCVVDALLSRQAVDAFANASVSFGDIQLRLDAHKHRLRW